MNDWDGKWWRCFHDGLEHGATHMRYSDAWMEMHRLQPFSVSHATQYERWSIEEVTKDGEIVTETNN